MKKNGDKVFFSLEPLHSLTLVLDAGAGTEDLEGRIKEMEESDADAELSFGGPWVRDCCRSLDYPAFTGTKEIVPPFSYELPLPETGSKKVRPNRADFNRRTARILPPLSGA